MNMIKSLKVCALLAATMSLTNTSFGQDVDLQDEDSRIAYSIGVNIGQSLVQQGLMEGVDF